MKLLIFFWRFSLVDSKSILGHFCFDTNSRSWWRKSNPWVLETQDWCFFYRWWGGWGWWLVGLVEFLWPKKSPPKTLTTGPRCWCALFCGVGLLPWVRNPLLVIFRRHSKWICLICFQPRFKEILGADGYDVGIPRAFPGSGGSPGMHDWTTSNDVEFLGQNEAVFQARPGKQDGCGIFWRREVGKSRLKLFNIAQAKELQLSIVSLTKFHPFIPSFLFISSMLLIQQAWILSQIHLTCYRKYLWETFVFTGPGVQSCLEAEWSFFYEAGRRSHESDFWGWTMSCLDLCTLLEILLDTLW